MTSREKKIFVACLACVLVYVSYVFVYQPSQARYSGVMDKIQVAQKKFNKDMRTVAQAKTYRAQYEKLLSDFKQSGTDDEILSSTLSQIEKGSADFKVKVAAMKPQKVKKGDFYHEFAVNVTLEGPLNELVRCIYTLQQPPNSFFINQVRLEKVAIFGNILQCQLVLSKVFFP